MPSGLPAQAAESREQAAPSLHGLVGTSLWNQHPQLDSDGDHAMASRWFM